VTIEVYYLFILFILFFKNQLEKVSLLIKILIKEFLWG